MTGVQTCALPIFNIISHKLEDLLIDDIDEIREQKNDYLEALDIFHDQFIDLENHRTVDTIMHGGHRAIGYFVDRYNLIYVNPYEGFSTDAEPTPSKIAYMIDLMETNEISYLYSEMLLSQIVSNTIQEQTGAEILYIYSMGNLSKDDFDNGLTFLDMMEHNLIQYQIGLGDRKSVV